MSTTIKSNITQTLTFEKNSYIHIQDYNKLKIKYENEKEENKKLKKYIEDLISKYEKISEGKKNIEEMFSAITDLIKTNRNIFKLKEDFSTGVSTIENTFNENISKSFTKSINSGNSANLNFSNINLNIKQTSSNQNNNTFLIKKIEEMEISYNDILKNFENLIIKYKMIKEEKNKVDDHNIILIDQIGNLNNEYNNIIAELNDCHVTIERFKEIDKCILDSAINSLFLNSNEKKKIIEKDNNKIVCNPYILCEPVPSFVKFINKYTK
jgi:predicted nuclease with TOPRIM domain